MNQPTVNVPHDTGKSAKDLRHHDHLSASGATHAPASQKPSEPVMNDVMEQPDNAVYAAGTSGNF